MFQKQSANNIEMPYIDHDQFEDPVALNTKWKPYEAETLIDNVQLKIIDDYRAEFRLTQSVLLWRMGLFLVAVVIVVPIILNMAPMVLETDFSTIDFSNLTIDSLLSSSNGGLPLLYIFLFLLPFIRLPFSFLYNVGQLTYKTVFKTPIIDKQAGYIWKGKPWSHETLNPYSTNKEFIELQNVYAVQLLPLRKTSRKKNDSTNVYYQMNLILQDGAQYGLVLYENRLMNKGKVRQEAQKLAEYLNVPLWDVLG